MRSLAFVTSNRLKFEVAVKTLADIDIKVVQENLETPEIQSDNNV